MDNFAIVKPFNLTFFMVTAFFILILVGASLIMRNKSDRAKRIVISSAAVLTLIGFIFYKYFLSIDAAYDEMTIVTTGGFNWWGELPLHLCNINMLLIPVAVMLDLQMLMSFCFFVGSICAALAIMMPGLGFDHYSIFLPRMMGYFGTHYMVVIMAIAIVTFGLYRPNFKDLPKTCVVITVITFCVYLINLLLIHTGLHPNANYFYSLRPVGNPLLELFYKWIPIPFLYLLPSLLILVPYMALVTTGFWLADRKRREITVSGTEAEAESTADPAND